MIRQETLFVLSFRLEVQRSASEGRTVTTS